MKRNLEILTVLLMSLLMASCSKDDANELYSGNYSFKTFGTFDITVEDIDLPVNAETTIHINNFSKSIDIMNQIGSINITTDEDNRVNVLKNVILGDEYLYGGKITNDTIYFDKIAVSSDRLTLNNIEDSYYVLNGDSVQITKVGLSTTIYSKGIGYRYNDLMIIDENYSGGLQATLTISTQMGAIDVPLNVVTISNSNIRTFATKQ